MENRCFALLIKATTNLEQRRKRRRNMLLPCRELFMKNEKFIFFSYFYICVNIRLFNSIIHNKNHNKTYFHLSLLLLLLDACFLCFFSILPSMMVMFVTNTHRIVFYVVYFINFLLCFVVVVFCYQLKIKIKMVEYCFSYSLPFFSIQCYE